MLMVSESSIDGSSSGFAGKTQGHDDGCGYNGWMVNKERGPRGICGKHKKSLLKLNRVRRKNRIHAFHASTINSPLCAP